jgi:flagellin
MVNKINDAIKLASNAGTAGANALKSAAVTASVVTDTNGAQRLAFSSNTAAFQVGAGNKTANALLGNFKIAGQPEGAVVDATATGGTVASTTAGSLTVKLHVIANGAEQDTAAIDLSLATDDGLKLTAINAKLHLINPEITASVVSGKITFTGAAGESFKVSATGDTGNTLGMGEWTALGTVGTPTVGGTLAGLGAGKSAVYAFSVNGGDAIQVSIDATDSTTVTKSLNDAFKSNATLKASGIVAVDGTTTVNLGASTSVRLSLVSATAGTTLLLSGTLAETAGTSAASLNGFSANAHAIDASSTSATGVGTNNDVFAFAGMRNAGDSQEINVSLTDAAGSQHAIAVTLSNSNAGDIDKAINTLNGALQKDPNMKHIVAVKELNKAGTAEGIRFISSDTSFNVKIGAATNYTTANPVGLYDGTAGAANPQGLSIDSSQSGTLDISSKDGGQQAVIAIGQAVGKLGTAQAAIGKGQNQLGYAISLANSQISNFSSAQAQIRDADVAMEAANLSKAQVLQQASIAAMAQANSAPQAVLSLLRG